MAPASPSANQPPQLPGSVLAEGDYQALARCFITRQVADAVHLRRVTDLEGRVLFGASSRNGNFAGLVFPYVDPRGGHVRAYRLRRDCSDLEERDGKLVERGKYLSAPGSGNFLYFVPGTRPEWLADRTLPVVISEGEKKTLALWRVAWHGIGDAAECPRFLPVGLSGVWSWRGRIGKATAADGSRQNIRGVIADLRQIVWQGREAQILFDANVQTNSDVRSARHQLAGWLTGQGARVRLADLPSEPGINGPDDAASKHGPEYVLDILAHATPLGRDEPRRVLTPAEEELVQRQPYVGWLQEYGRYAQACLPEVPADYHILTGLVLAGGILSAQLETETRLRPNLAGVIVAFQGAGKSLPAVIARQLIDPIEVAEAEAYTARLRDLKFELAQVSGSKSEDGQGFEELRENIGRMERAGRPAIIIATQASVEGLLEALSHEPCGIADFDEFGAFLKDCRRDHMRSARENLIKALDGRPIFYRRARGESVDVRKPSLSLWGTVNVESLRLATTDEDMFGGFFSRILFCAPDYDFTIPSLQAGNPAVAEELTAILRRWRNMGPVCVELEPGVRERALEYAYTVAPLKKGERVDITEPEDQVAAVGYIRYGTHALKVAILIAASEELREEASNTITVTPRHLLLAIDLVERFRRQTLRLLRHLETRDPLLIDADKLLAKIRRYPGRDRSQYQRMMRLNAQGFNRVLTELEHSRRVSWDDQPSTGGRKRRIYFSQS